MGGHGAWWCGHTVRCGGCGKLFPALDDASPVVTVQGDPCGWHEGLLESVTEEEAAARRTEAAASRPDR